MRVIDQYTVKEIMSDENLKEVAYKETMERKEVLNKVDELLVSSYQYMNVHKVAELYEVSANRIVEVLDIDRGMLKEMNVLISRKDVLQTGFLLKDYESDFAKELRSQISTFKDIALKHRNI